MKIYIMRHGDAKMRADTDANRPLSKLGCTQSLQMAQLCQKKMEQVEFDLVLVSPYLRAMQTWQEVKQVLKAKKMESCEDITPYGSADSVVEYIQARAEVESLNQVLLISHLPLVSYLTTAFVVDARAPIFQTASMLCLEYNLETKQGEILWHLSH